MKTLVAVPCMDTVDAMFAQSLARLERAGDVLIEFEMGSLINFSRDKLAGKALGAGADYILWLDSDMVFEPDLLIRLMADIRGRDLVTGIYHYRKPPYRPVIWEQFRHQDANGEKAINQYLDYPKDRLFKVEACGFGGCLMRTSMIEPIVARFQALFEPLKACGEDMSFCSRATACGFQMWADPAIQLGHRGYMVCDYEQYNAWRAMEVTGNAGESQSGAEADG